MLIKVFAIIIIPIIIAFLSAVVCLLEAHNYKNILIEEYCKSLFAIQVNTSSVNTQLISYRLSKEIYKIPFYLNVINSFYDKVIQGKVKYNPAHQKLILNYFLVQANLEEQSLTQLALKNPFLFDGWYEQNEVNLQNLDSQEKTIIQNCFLGSAIKRAIIHKSRERQDDQLDQIPYQSIFQGSNYKGLFFSTYQKNSLLGLVDLNNLDQKPKYDPRKRFWYQNSLNQTSFYMNEPNLSFGKDESYLSQFGCQKLMYFNNNTQKVEVYHVLCINTMIKNLSTYFKNVIKLSKQYYVIDPRTLQIIYNQNHEQNLTSTSQLDNFYNFELEFLEDQQQSNDFINLITSKYQNLIFNTSNNTKTTLKQMVEQDQYQFIFDYKRNSSTYKVIINLVISYHDIPEFITRYSGQAGQQLQEVYLQINMISNQDLRTQTNSLTQFSNVLLILSSVCISLIGLMFVGAIFQYLLLVKRQVYNPIDKITQILQRINLVSKHLNINEKIIEFQQNADDIFLSHETRSLYNSFYDLFQHLQYLNEQFFIENEGKTLIDLNNKVNFFKKFNNYYALGIAHNNIGSILLNQKHYFQSLEHFDSSIVCAKYEIKEFCERTDNLFFKKVLQPYSYIDSHQLNLNKAQNSTNKYENSFSLRIQNKEKNIDESNVNQMNQLSHQTKQIRTKQYKSNQIMRDNSSISQSQKRIVRTKNSIFSKNMTFFANVQNDEEQFEEFQPLIQSLFYRKLNKINALVVFQQQIDNDKRQKNFYNFWEQIKLLSKELIKLSSQLNQQQDANLVCECIQFKCYYRMYNFQKAEKKIQKTKQILKNNQALLKSKTTIKYQPNNQKLHTSTNRQSHQKFNFFNVSKENTLEILESPIAAVTSSAYYQSHHNISYLDQTNLDFTNQILNQKNNIDKNKKKIHGTKTLKQDSKINETFIKEKQQQNKPPSLFNMHQNNQYEMIQYNYAEYLIFTKQYKKAAFTLTELLENSKYLISNMPYRIFFKMKEIFDLFKIQDQSIIQQQERFNKNKIFQIVISFEVQNPIQNIQKPQSQRQSRNENDGNEENIHFSFNQILLFKSLIDQILVKNNDQISISLNNLSKESVQQFMPLIQMSNFKHQKQQILNQINNSILQNQNIKESFNSELQYYLLENKISTQINNNFHLQSSFDFNESELSFQSLESYYNNTEEKIKLNSTSYSNNFYLMGKNNQMNLQKQLNQTDLNHKTSMDSQVLHNQQNQQMKEYFSQDYRLNSKQNINQKKINSLDELHISLHQDSNTKNYQEKNNTQDIQNDILIERNNTFHYFIRQALEQHISKQINYKLTENELNTQKQQISHTFYKNIRESSLHVDQKIVEINEKLIIYQTEEIFIIKNNLFMSLCQLLSQFNIQIIIFASKRGNSFIEKSENQTFVFNNFEIIKAFYSAKKIVQYLFQKRDQFDKQVYYSFIQHY